MLDDIDRLLISELQNKGRKSLVHIAEKTDITHVAIRKRLINLMKRGILSISANLNLEELNAKTATVNVEVENYTRLKELMDIYKDCPRTVFLAPLSASNLISIIIGEDYSTLKNVVGICSLRAQKGIRSSKVHIGDLPIYPKYLPIRITAQRSSHTAPCGAVCNLCESFKINECMGCPSTKYYNGPL